MNEIVIHLPFASLLQNVWDRMHFQARKRHMRTIAEAIIVAVRPPAVPIKQCTIRVIRRSAMEPDHSNAIGGLKPILDVLCMQGKPNKLGNVLHPCGLGFIEDDNPKCIIAPIDLRHEKCKRGAGSTEIVITVVEASR